MADGYGRWPAIVPAISRQPSAMTGFLLRHSHLRLLFDDAAVEDVDAAVGVPRVARIVRDHADRRAAAMQLAEQIHHRFAAARVEVSRRLVRQQDQRLAGDRARHSDALLLTAGQLTRKMLRAVRHPDALERRLDALPA